MKLKITLLLLLLSAFICHLSFAQNAAVVFTEESEKFTLYVNGEQMNAAPSASVKLRDLTQEFCKVKVVFENPALGQYTYNMGLKPGLEVTYMIKKNKDGEYVFRYRSEAPFTGGSSTQTVTPVKSADPVNTSTTTTTTTVKSGDAEQVNMNVNGLNINVKAGENGASIDMGSLGNVNVNTTGMNTGVKSSTTVTQTTTSTSSNSSTQTASTGNSCLSPMNTSEFSEAKSTISNRSFEEDKMKVAKQVANANCLSVVQIKDMLGLFSFEESKVDFAKYCYKHCYDPKNYYKINDAFTFSGSVDELNAFIENQ
jgi:predicted RecA/RadA family phage recombinase